jgi:hypothetical protein
MKAKITLLLCFIMIIGCSRQQVTFSDYNAESFYFTSKNGALYEFSGAVNKMPSEKVNNIYKPQVNKHLFTSNSSAMSLMKESGNIIHRYESDQNIAAATVSNDLGYFYFVNKNGGLFKYMTNTSELEQIAVDRIYPPPKQIIMGADNQLLFHDGHYLHSIDLLTNTIKRETEIILPISTIAYHQATDKIFISTSSDGRIYSLKPHDEIPSIYLEPISANGSVISINNNENVLYYTKNDIRDTTIYKHNLITKESAVITVLYNIPKVLDITF